MRFKKIVTIAFALLVTVLLSFGCKSKDDATLTTQTAIVQRGTLTVEVTASGNLAFSQTDDLAFDVSGYVYRVLVEVGDPVEEGELVADVDSFDWEKEKSSLERAVVDAQISLNSAIRNLEDTENPTTTTSAISGSVSAPDPLEVESAEWQVDKARMSLDAAQQELDRYLETSSQVLATFDGFVTAVHVTGGDEIYKGAIAVSIADPNKYEAEIMVNEMDIGNIQIGQSATVEVEALPDVTLPAKVTAISPTATNSSGVVYYTVKVELLTAEEIEEQYAEQAEEGTQPLSGQAPVGQMPEGEMLTGEMPTGEMPTGQMPTGQMPEGAMPAGPPSDQTAASSSQSLDDTLSMLEELRDGLSVTISIIIEEKEDVLMVPNRAITTMGNNSVVQVLTGETTEARVVQTGITDLEYTEITDGLSEGEEVVISQATTTSTTTTQQQGGPGGFGMPGMGGGPPP